MVKRALPLLIVAVALWPARAWPASSASAVVDVIKVQGVIDPSMAGFVRDSIEEAERDHASVILQIDSRGDFGRQAESLGRFLRDASVPVIAWVGPSAARAEGAALFVVYGASLVAVAPGAGIGPGRPFDLATKASGEPPRQLAAEAGELALLAVGSGTPAAAISRLVGGASLAAGPAQRAGAAAQVAVSIPDLLRRLDGRTIRTAAGTTTLATLNRAGRPVIVEFREIGLLGRILHAVSTPTAVFVLLLIGLWGIAFELTQPGIGMAGVAGALALALAGYGLTVIPVHWLGVVVLVAGIAAQGVDVLIKRVGLLTIAGTAAFLAGSLLAWWGVAPAVDLSLWLVILATIAGFLLFGFGMTVALKARERVRTAQVGLVGLTGEVRSDLNPEGGVYVKGSIWRARSTDGFIPKGARVRVKAIEGLVLRVEPESE
jgi:membrane-bound serine protease (ClpP class)